MKKENGKWVVNGIIACILVAVGLALNTDQAISVMGRMTPQPIRQGDGSLNAVALCCNVVWGTEFVPQILDILDEKDVKATFFLGGEWTRDNPELAKEIVLRGHEIGNHGDRHKDQSKLSREDNQKEIQTAEDSIAAATGIRTTLFAPPSGDYGPQTLEVADMLGYRTILWSIDTIDWRRDGVDNIISRTFKKPHPGAFILMHPTADTVKALPAIIDGMADLGYSCATVSDLIPKQAGVLTATQPPDGVKIR